MIHGTDQAQAECYPWKDAAHRAFAIAATQYVAHTGNAWAAAEQPFQDGAPRPEPQLRAQPRY
jgi:hypothetical protein